MVDEPALYAALHRGSPGDLVFYRHACRDAATVLELGCGYGRILQALASRNRRVTGLDLDAGLLALARSAVAALPPHSRPYLVRGDMRRFELSTRFQRIIIPYNGLYCLGSRDEQVACLAAAARHLETGGQLLFDGYAIDTFHDQTDPREPWEDDGEPVAVVQCEGHTFDVFEETDWDRDAQRLTAHYLFRPRDGSPARQETIHHRYLLSGQLSALIRDAGLQLLGVRGDFAGAALTPESEHMVVTAARA